MKDNKFYWVAIVIVVAIGVLLFVNRSGETVEQQVASESPGDSSQPPVAVSEPMTATPAAATQAKPAQAETNNANAEGVSFDERLAAMQQRRPNQQFDPAAVEAAMQRQAAWAPAEEVPEDLPLQPEEFTDGRQFIELDSLKIETLMPGDAVKVTIDETGEDYNVTVDRVEKHDYNSISWYGHIEGADGQTYSVSFTRGETLTVGGLDTPEGHYVLQAHGNNGWIASSALLFKIDPNVDDAIYPHDVEQQVNHSDHDH
jgi:hypothetical protein